MSEYWELKEKISDIPYFSNMGGELRKGHCGGNYV